MASDILKKDSPTITIKRQYSEMKFIVTFDANGGVCSTIEKEYSFPSDNYGTLPTPTRIGYKFTGWYTEQSHGNGIRVLNSSNALIQNRTLYAHWVELDVNLDGALISDEDASYSVGINDVSTYSTLAKPIKANWFFAGWYKEESHGDSTTQIKSTTEIDDSITKLYAHWVELDVQNGSFPDTTTTYYSDESYYYNLPTPTRQNYKFVGWYTAPNSGTKIRTSTYSALNDSYSRLYAFWVYFDANGGTLSSSSITAASNTSTTYNTLPLCNTQTNKQFLGWYTEVDGGTKQYSGSSIISGQTTLYAHWLYFDTSGGNDVTPGQSYSSTSSTYNTLPIPTKTNCKFLGWFTVADDTSDTTGTKILTSNSIQPSLFTVYARWLKFEDNGTTVAVSVGASGNNSNSYGTLPTSTLSGSKFLGWYSSEIDGVKILENSTITSICKTANTVVYARWLTFNSNGGSTVTSTTAASNTSTTYGTLPTSTLNGSKFLGWYSSESGGVKIFENSSIDSLCTSYSTTVYAYWVLMDSNGGDAVTNTTPASNMNNFYGEMPIATYEGYHLVGWFTDNISYTTEKTASSTIDTSIKTLYSKWLLKQKVTFHVGEGTIDTTEVYYAAGYTYGTYGLPTPTYDGHAFGGWYTTEDYSGDVITDESIFDGVITDLYAKWLDEITVTFNANGGTCSTLSSQHLPGTKYLDVGLPIATKSGSVFDGWHIGSASGEKIGLDATVASSSITVYANWKTISSETIFTLFTAKANALYSTNQVTFSQESGQGTVQISKVLSPYPDLNYPFSAKVGKESYPSQSTSYNLVITATTPGTITYQYRGCRDISATAQHQRTIRMNVYEKIDSGSFLRFISSGTTDSQMSSWRTRSATINTSYKMYVNSTYDYYQSFLYVSDFTWTPTEI